MLVEELNRTNRFVVVDRADLDALLREKQMALGDVSKGASGAPLLAAQTFVRGSVTEFDQDEKGGGFSIGLGLNGNGGGASRRVANGHVAIDLRMIDSETGVVLATAHVDRKVRSSSIALSGMARNVSFGGDQFRNTSLGKASRAAIEEAVAQIISGMERVPFEALVARVDGPHIYINAGRSANIAPGSRMRILRSIDTVRDPQTGEVLGGSKQTIADLVIDRVEDRFAAGTVQPGGSPASVGDIVQLLGP